MQNQTAQRPLGRVATPQAEASAMTMNRPDRSRAEAARSPPHSWLPISSTSPRTQSPGACWSRTMNCPPAWPLRLCTTAFALSSLSR